MMKNQLRLFDSWREKRSNYDALPTSPSPEPQAREDGTPTAPPNRQPNLYRILIILLTTLSALVVLAAAAIVINHTLPERTAAQLEDQAWNHCGRSSAAARQRGCVMEPLFYGWMPPQCVYRELSDSLPVFEDRTYWLDMNRTRVVTAGELWAGEHAKVYTRRYHAEHCLFQWRKLQWAMDHRMEFVDNKTVSRWHTGHCADQLSDPAECEGPNDLSIVELGFYRCRKTIW